MTEWWCHWPGLDEDSLWGTMQGPLAKNQSCFLEVSLSGSPPHGESMLPGMCVHGLHEELRFCTSWWCQCVLLLLFGWSDPCSITHWPPKGLFWLPLPGKAPWFSPHLSVQLLGAQQIDRDAEWEEEPASWMLLKSLWIFSEMEGELTTFCLSLHFGLPISYVGKWQLTHLWHVQDFLEKRWQTLDLESGTSSPCSLDTSCWASLMVWFVWSIRGLWFSSIPGFYKTTVKSSLEKVVMMSFILLLVRWGRVYK